MINYQLVEDLGKKLLNRHGKLVTAESCTGGGLSYWITSIDGSSTWFDRGFITYSNLSKCQILGIESALLENYGAVSEVAALAMAKGALARSEANISIAITGIAGPSGASPQNPVGSVWIAVLGHIIEPLVKHYLFEGGREEVRYSAILNAIKQTSIVL